MNDHQYAKLVALALMSFGLALQVFALFGPFAAGLALVACGTLLYWGGHIWGDA